MTTYTGTCDGTIVTLTPHEYAGWRHQHRACAGIHLTGATCGECGHTWPPMSSFTALVELIHRHYDTHHTEENQK